MNGRDLFWFMWGVLMLGMYIVAAAYINDTVIPICFLAPAVIIATLAWLSFGYVLVNLNKDD